MLLATAHALLTKGTDGQADACDHDGEHDGCSQVHGVASFLRVPGPLRPGAIRRYSMPYAAWGCTAGTAFFAEKSGMGRSSWNKIAASTATAAAVPGVNPPPARNVPN